MIVGAGLSGIGAGRHLQARCPGKTFVILEGRATSGGTWDLFRYPGIRSDSDMYTLGYSFKPWKNAKAIADGSSILEYIREAASETGVDRAIRYEHWVTRASWSSSECKWTVEATHGPARKSVRFTCGFLFMCSGYYRYSDGYTPELPGIEKFAGRVVHPQKWTSDIDYANKRVVVIGSGATAVTLVPSMAKTAAHVTMLQRSPTYIVSAPAEDRIANTLRALLPAKLAYEITRWKNVAYGMLTFQLARKRPRFVKSMILKGVRKELGRDYDIAAHFTPTYKPWDQRICLVPDSDLFAAIRAGSASVVTDHIERFTEHGIQLRGGRTLEADIVVTATGLQLEVLGGLTLTVDGELADMSSKLTYKGMMYSDLPNFASSFGYTNASWTLKCDLTCRYVCRLLNFMSKHGYRSCTPRKRDGSDQVEPFASFSSGYIQRSVHLFPKQGVRAPWKLYQNYAMDMAALKLARVDDDVMEFSK